MDQSASVHDPSPDRLLGPLASLLVRRPRAAPRAAGLSLLSLIAAAGAAAACFADARAVAALLILVAALLDAAAGARPARSAGFGAVVDGVVDRYADLLILAGLALWSQRHESLPAPLAVAFLALSGALALSYAAARVQASAGREAARRLFGWMGVGRDVRLLVAAVGIAAGQAYIALVILALLTLIPVAVGLVRLPALLPARPPD